MLHQDPANLSIIMSAVLERRPISSVQDVVVHPFLEGAHTSSSDLYVPGREYTSPVGLYKAANNFQPPEWVPVFTNRPSVSETGNPIDSYEAANHFQAPQWELFDIHKHLRKGDKVVSSHVVALHPNPLPMHHTNALLRLTGVTNASEIGREKTVMAATCLPENEHLAETALFTDAVFGRDSLISAMLLEKDYPQLKPTTIYELARRQCLSDFYTERNDGLFGKIPHEDRKPGDKARMRLEEKNNWMFPYFGAEDATPLFVKAIASQVKHLHEIGEDGNAFLDTTYIGQDGNEHTIRESMTFAVRYLKGKLDQNNEGLLEFKRTNPMGLENQAWKDSWDSYHHADGTIANHNDGIASVEIQGYAYDALLDAAELLPDMSWELKARAMKLRDTVMEKFWVEDEEGGYFALGTDRGADGELRPMKIRTSNMGHLLNSRLLEGDDYETKYKRTKLVETLFSEAMLSANGIRTLSKYESRFKPTAYHNGSVWLQDNAIIAQGLEKYRYFGLAREMYESIVRVCDKTGKYPEFIQGNGSVEPVLNKTTTVIFSARDGRNNCISQVCQDVQAWAVASYIFSRDRLGVLPFEGDDYQFENKLLTQIWEYRRYGSQPLAA